MTTLRKTISLLASLSLIMAAGGVLSEEEMVARFSGYIDSQQTDLYLGSGGALILVMGDPADPYLDVGTWDLTGGKIVFKLSGAGEEEDFECTLEAGILSLREEGAEEWQRLYAQPLEVPPALAGQWEGTDQEGVFVFSFGANGVTKLAYTNGREVGSGIFLTRGNYLLVSFNSGIYLQYEFSVSGDALNLKTFGTNESFTAKRRSPAVTAVMPQTAAPVFSQEPNDDWLKATPAPPAEATAAPAPDWLGGEATAAPAEATAEPTPDWLDGNATAAPAPDWLGGEATAAPAEATVGPAPDWLDDNATAEPTPDWLGGEATAAPAEATAELASLVPPGLAGNWESADGSGTLSVRFGADGALEITRGEAAPQTKTGSFTATGNDIAIRYDDGSSDAFRYILTSDRLLLSDLDLKNPVTLSRAPETAQPQWDPLLVGTWGKNSEGVYDELSFAADGRASTFVPEDESQSASLSWTADGSLIALRDGDELREAPYRVQGDLLTFEADGAQLVYARKKGALTRLAREEDPAEAKSDPVLLGTWGGRRGGSYQEWSFAADGSLGVFAPRDDTLSAGSYMALGGTLMTQAQAQAEKAAYAVDGNRLTLEFPYGETLVLDRKPGPLARLEE